MCNLSTGILERGIEQGMMETLFSLVRKGLLTLTDAASQADMDSAVFKEEYENYCRK